MLQDISTQHLVRQQIGDLTDRLAIANEAGGIGVWDCDLVHDSLVIDARLGELLGLPRPLPSSGALAEVLAPALMPEDALVLRQALDSTIAELTPLNLELRLAAENAQKPAAPPGCAPEITASRWIHLSGRAHADGSGRAVRLVGCAWESSLQHQALEMKAARDAADNASRAKTAFLSRMSHELRTPLNAILGFSQLMRMEAETGDLVLKPHRVTLIESAARHLLDLVNEVMDVTRIEAGQMDIRLVRCDLRSIVHESLPLVQGQADAMQVTLVDRLAEGPSVRVHGDRLRLKELLINLLSNAVKFNHKGGRVDISAHAVPGGIELQVADTGRGLDATQLQNLFQPFNRLGAESLGIEGSGMGLFVCHRFVELMGGELRLNSQPGVGTTVVARLNAPVEEESSPQDYRLPPPTPNLSAGVNPRGTP